MEKEHFNWVKRTNDTVCFLTDYTYLHLPYQVFAYYSTEQPEGNGLVIAGTASSTLLLGFTFVTCGPIYK